MFTRTTIFNTNPTNITNTSIFDKSELTENIKKSLLTTIKNNDRFTFTSLITTHKLSTNDIVLDPYNNNLLHISVLHKSYNIVQYLINTNFNVLRTNQFNETPIDIALKNHDEKMMRILVDNNKYETENKSLKEDNTYLKNENKRLDDKIKNLECNNTKLLDSNKTLTQKNNYLYLQLENEKNFNITHKRKFSDLESENTKLKNENKSLKDDNELLQKTVKTLKDLAKK